MSATTHAPIHGSPAAARLAVPGTLSKAPPSRFAVPSASSIHRGSAVLSSQTCLAPFTQRGSSTPCVAAWSPHVGPPHLSTTVGQQLLSPSLPASVEVACHTMPIDSEFNFRELVDRVEQDMCEGLLGKPPVSTYGIHTQEHLQDARLRELSQECRGSSRSLPAADHDRSSTNTPNGVAAVSRASPLFGPPRVTGSMTVASFANAALQNVTPRVSPPGLHDSSAQCITPRGLVRSPSPVTAIGGRSSLQDLSTEAALRKSSGGCSMAFCRKAPAGSMGSSLIPTGTPTPTGGGSFSVQHAGAATVPPPRSMGSTFMLAHTGEGSLLVKQGGSSTVPPPRSMGSQTMPTSGGSLTAKQAGSAVGSQPRRGSSLTAPFISARSSSVTCVANVVGTSEVGSLSVPVRCPSRHQGGVVTTNQRTASVLLPARTCDKSPDAVFVKTVDGWQSQRQRSSSPTLDPGSRARGPSRRAGRTPSRSNSPRPNHFLAQPISCTYPFGISTPPIIAAPVQASSYFQSSLAQANSSNILIEKIREGVIPAHLPQTLTTRNGVIHDDENSQSRSRSPSPSIAAVPSDVATDGNERHIRHEAPNIGEDTNGACEPDEREGPEERQGTSSSSQTTCGNSSDDETRVAPPFLSPSPSSTTTAPTSKPMTPSSGYLAKDLTKDESHHRFDRFTTSQTSPQRSPPKISHPPPQHKCSSSVGRLQRGGGQGATTPLKQRSTSRPNARSPHLRERELKANVEKRSESGEKLTGRNVTSPRSSHKHQEPSLQMRLTMAMIAEEHGMAPGASDKWKVMQLFHETIPRSEVRIDRIDRLACIQDLGRFFEKHGRREQDCPTNSFRFSLEGKAAEEFEVGFYAPSSLAHLTRLRETGFCANDFEDLGRQGCGVPISPQAGAAYASWLQEDEPRSVEHCMCVVLCPPSACGGLPSSRSPSPARSREYCVVDPAQIFLAYIVWFQQLIEEPAPSPALMDEQDRRTMVKRKRLERQQREYAKVRDPLVKVALQGLAKITAGVLSTVLLPSTSVEAESVVSLYLLGGGGSRMHRPPGVDPREALGGVVVQRIENQPLFRQFSKFGQDNGDSSKSGNVPRYREDVVWHGTRLKRVDGEGASLATKLQSIAEKGFDPQRCMKGAAAEGGIWVATSPLQSFGSGCDGLVAFVLCLAKTTFNEWVDASSARVLQRERVLPLYSLVHA